jgi:hypothetical protein
LRKLCTDEVEEVKMKKNEKKRVLLLFLAAPLALHFRDDF